MTADELHLLETATHSEASRNDTVSAWTGTAGEQFRLSAYPSSAGENNGGGDLTADWDKWRRHLLRRNRTKLLRQLARDRCSMLRWNWREDDAGRIGLLLDVLEHRAGKRGANRKSLKSTSQEWLSPRERRNRPIVAAGADASLQNGTHGAPHFENGSVACSLSSDGGQSKVAAAFESLAWLHLLADRVELFNGKLWRQVWHTLREEAHNPPPAIEADALAHQLAAAELPLTIAYLFPELARGSSLMIAAAAAISHCMTELLDAEGMPHCRYLGVFPALAASWTRCRLIAEQLDGSGWPNDCERRFPLILQAAVRLERQNGGMPLTGGLEVGARRSYRNWLAVAADLVADKPTRRLLRAASRNWRTKRGRTFDSSRLPNPALHSERAELAILRPDWRVRSERLTVAYAGGITRMELAVGGDILLSGAWELELHADGAPLKLVGGWREVCWVSDADCDYLELEMDLGVMQVQRHMLLAREDKFLFLADAVLGSARHELTYRGRLPLAPGLSASAAAETREVLLEARKAQAMILPLALPEWRADHGAGGLDLNGGRLELRQAAAGPRLFAPLWIDLSRRRGRGAFTWRQLTVAEQRQNLASDTAVGYRVQFGRRQWVIYRSLAPAANRTVLGQNLSSEFFLGRFDRSGETETIVEIE